MNERGSARAPVLLGLVSVAFLAGFLCVLPSSAYLHPGTHDGFVAGQALDHLAWIAAEPHHLGTEENAKVRGRLVEELRALGFEPELQSKWIDVSEPGAHWLEEDLAHAESEAAEGGDPTDAVATPDSEGTDEASAEDEPEATVELVNVLVRIEGTGDDGAALLMAHYDSRPGAPGAGDDGAAVASLLVVLREFVIAGVPPRNDVIVMFDDGEEFGLLGAELFAEEHPWMEDVRAVFNFEARGNGGPTILFETGADSGAWVEAFAQQAPKPVGTSLAPAVYRRLPNDTSFSVFRDRGVPGLNFAFVGGASAYHRPTDTPENLRLDTLQHQGEAVRTCFRLAAETDLATQAALPDPIFFNLPVLGLVRMGRGANLAVGALAILLALAAVRGRRPDIVGSLQLTLSPEQAERIERAGRPPAIIPLWHRALNGMDRVAEAERTYLEGHREAVLAKG